MIKVVAKIDSVEGQDKMIQFGCDWEILSEMTEEESQAAQLTIAYIKQAFEDIQTSVLLNGGSVERLDKKGNNGKR